MIQNITAGDMVVDLDDIRKIPMPAIQFHDEYRRGYAEALIDVAALARRAEPSMAAELDDLVDGRAITQDWMAYCTIQRQAGKEPTDAQGDAFEFAWNAVRSALASSAVSQMDRAAVAWRYRRHGARFWQVTTNPEVAATMRGHANIEVRDLADVTPAATTASASECETCNGSGYYEHKGNDTACRVCGGTGRAQAPSREAAPDLLSEIATALDLLADTKMTTSTYVNVTNVLHHCRDAITGKGCYGASHAANAGEDTEQDAERWRMLPAFYEEYQINGLKLLRDIDQAIASSTAQEGK
jgi:hypothetical protein